MPSRHSLAARELKPILTRLQRANRAVAESCPGETGARQPVHTFYGGAHLFRATPRRDLVRSRMAALDKYAPDAATLDAALGLATRPLRRRFVRASWKAAPRTNRGSSYRFRGRVWQPA